jgi:hypothetical protein
MAHDGLLPPYPHGREAVPRQGRLPASRAGDPAGEGGRIGGLPQGELSPAPACPHNPPVSTLTGGAIPTLNSRPVDAVETTSGETVPDSEFSD